MIIKEFYHLDKRIYLECNVGDDHGYVTFACKSGITPELITGFKYAVAKWYPSYAIINTYEDDTEVSFILSN